MRSFAQLTGIHMNSDPCIRHFLCYPLDFPTMKFSPLLLSILVIVATVVGVIAGFVLKHYLIGILSGAVCLIVPLAFLCLLRYLLRRKDYVWTANMAQFIKKRLEIFRFLLQVLFMNPYVHRRSNLNDTTDCKKMK